MKKILIILCVIITTIVGILVYKNKGYEETKLTEKDILAGIEEKDKIRNELSNIINGTSNIDENYQISISEARQKAIIIFKSLGEDNLNKDNVYVREIERNGKKYYYISSLKNSAEIEINTGKVTKINNVAQ